MNPLSTWASLVSLEIIIIGFEGLIYLGLLGYPGRQAWILSALANGASCAVGLWLSLVLR